MTMRRRARAGIIAAATAFTALLLAAIAYATTVPDVLYDPPLLEFTDRYQHATGEDLTVTKQGPHYVFANPNGVVRHPKSDPGCDKNYSTAFKCPVKGVERLILRLRGADDRARVDLGSRARSVKQLVLGGVGVDVLRGAAGRQVLKGGSENDRLRGGRGNDKLRGGPGNDLLVGGRGVDDCKGGPGKDVLRGCE